MALRAGAGGRGLRARDEHLQLLAALGAGNADDAERLMRVAIQRFRDELIEALRSSASVLDAALVA